MSKTKIKENKNYIYFNIDLSIDLSIGFLGHMAKIKKHQPVTTKIDVVTAP
jgi:hypothetical protein